MKIWINIFSVVLLFGIFSCGRKLSGGLDQLDKVSKEKLIEALDSISKSTPTFLSTKIDTKYSDNKQNINFKTSLKINKDTAVHALISFAGIPIITAMVTQDTVKISNKKDKCYIIQNMEFFEAQFGVNFSYSNLEELLLGRPLNFNKNTTYFLIEDPYNYIISTQKDKTDQGKLLISYHLSRDMKQLKRVEVTSFKDEVTISVEYPEYHIGTNFNAPKQINAIITSPKNEISLSMAYDKVEIDVPKEMIIVIPDSYEQCK